LMPDYRALGPSWPIHFCVASEGLWRNAFADVCRRLVLAPNAFGVHRNATQFMKQ
jgi:hypothetical protein